MVTSTRGGARKGAGRKPTGRTTAVLSVTVPLPLLARLRADAAAAGETLSRHVSRLLA